MRDIIVFLDNIRSALNVGAIIRTCDGAGVSKILINGISPDGTHPKVQKTALGAETSIKIMRIENSINEIEKFKKEGYQIIAIEETKDSVSMYEASLEDKLLLIFGHEITGVSQELLNISDRIVSLPMLGQKKSLNVATTAGIVIYNLKFGHK